MIKSSFQYKENRSCYVLSGALNVETVPELWQQSRDILKYDKDSSLIFDLENVTQSDSSGVALLITWARQFQNQDKKIYFVHLPNQMLAIVKVAGLEKVLPIKI